jgi:hypothetical protein
LSDDGYEQERRRLAAMLPGAVIERSDDTRSVLEIVAEVNDLDLPIPVLVERGGYAYPADVNAALTGRRWLRWPATGEAAVHLHLVRSSGSSAS